MKVRIDMMRAFFLCPLAKTATATISFSINHSASKSNRCFKPLSGLYWSFAVSLCLCLLNRALCPLKRDHVYPLAP